MHLQKQLRSISSFVLFFFLLYSCSIYSISLQSAYKIAGENKKELKAVISKYSKEPADSLKLKAAIFLIENMDGHFSYQSKAWDEFSTKADVVFTSNLSVIEAKNAYSSLFDSYENKLYEFEELEDLKTIKAEFLIENIDLAFEAWKSPYAKHLNFNEFCEYILPYRVGNETLISWRKIYRDKLLPYFPKNDSTTESSIINACNILIKHFTPTLFQPPYFIPDYNSLVIFNLKFGTCSNHSMLAVLAARAIGIPVAINGVKQWGVRSGGHEWNSVFIEQNKSVSFDLGSPIAVVGTAQTNYPLRKMPKCYRITFKKQHESLCVLHGNELIPLEFSSTFEKDISTEHFKGIDIDVKLSLPLPPSNNKYAYLSVFNNQNWTPVHWAVNTQQHALFKTMNIGLVYLPCYYYNEEILPAAYPLCVKENGVLQELKPNITKKQIAILNRKFTDVLVVGNAKSIVGAKFQAANDSAFSDAVDLHIITQLTDVNFQTIQIPSNNKYKYFRYLSPKRSKGKIAEIELYTAVSQQKVQGRIIGSKQTKDKCELNTVFDGNILTYMETDEKTPWVGMEFKTPTQLSKIVYLPQNDDNFIRDGELYELFYWDNKWVSLGRQTGSIKTQSLTYTNAPTNALFLLRNLTKGREERIFTYENGKQVWW